VLVFLTFPGNFQKVLAFILKEIQTKNQTEKNENWTSFEIPTLLGVLNIELCACPSLQSSHQPSLALG